MTSTGKSGGSGGGNGFKPLGLSDAVFKGVVRMGFRNPTPVQRKALPVVLSGADTVVMARTGSGKTAAFLIPLLETLMANSAASTSVTSVQRPGVRGLVLSPTRELSLQTLRVLKKLSHFTNIRSIGIHGGEGMENQFNALSSKPDVIIATPGRLAHHLSEIPDFNLKDCQICILDEADRLLEMGFAMQLREISRSLPPDRCQKVLLSATMPKMLVEFTKGGFTTDPQMVRLDQEANVSEDLRVSFITCRSLEKDAVLLQILSTIQDDTEKHQGTRTGLTLIFCATRHHVEYLANLLQASGQQVAMIYGTMDHQARNSNLAAFRNGSKPIMVVTDVAARGVDIPFMDHVIHYHFPPTAKLFIHRSGRAARAGRIGYCWSLVEPEEMSYMVDLHLFLGRKLTTSQGTTSTERIDLEEDNQPQKAQASVKPYTLNEMTPEMVHYGSVPESILTLEVENVRRIMDSELSGSEQAEAISALSKVCTNAMKQYRKTRPEASREGVRRAKAILEGIKVETGERVNGSSIPPHPLLEGLEREQYERRKKEGKVGVLNDLDNQKKRQEFLLAMSRFRPKETVFEAFATGGGKETGVGSQVDKGRTTVSTKKNDSSFALSAMKRMRRQMRMARDKGSSLVVAGSQNALEQNDEGHGVDKIIEPQYEEAPEINNGQNNSLKMSLVDSMAATLGTDVHVRRRLSKAERKRLKKNPDGVPETLRRSKNDKVRRETDYRDPAFFIENDAVNNHEETQRQKQVEAAMQPSAANSIKGIVGNAHRIEEAMMDIVGDERDEMVQKHRMMRWDKSKRKYIQTTVGAELSGESYSKRMKLESGQIVKADKMKLGELYEKWQKKTNRSIGRDGVFDTVTPAEELDTNTSSTGRRNGSGKSRGKNAMKKSDSDKPRSAKLIKQEREEKLNMKLKNMKKEDRRRLERRQKGKDGSTSKNKIVPKKVFPGGKKHKR